MAISGGAQLTFTAWIADGRLVCDRIITTNGLDCLDPVDAVHALMDGKRVRVNAYGGAKARLVQMWHEQVGGNTE